MSQRLTGDIPVNTRRSPNAALLLDKPLRHWPSIEPVLARVCCERDVNQRPWHDYRHVRYRKLSTGHTGGEPVLWGASVTER